MKVLIIDDTPIWLREGKRILEKGEFEVNTYQVKEPSKTMMGKKLQPELKEKIEACEVILVDKDIGEGIDSTLFCCVVRHHFPKLAIIRWTSGHEWRNDYMRILGISLISKPTKRPEKEEQGKTGLDIFPKTLTKAIEEQKLILGDALAVFDHVLKERTGGSGKEEDYHRNSHDGRLRQLQQISQLAKKHEIPVLDENGKHECDHHGRYRYWQTYGEDGDILKHELGHCICDGDLSPEEVEPFLPALRKVVKMVEIDERFRICAEFILSEAPVEEMVLIHRCY